jgi:drug/metabolite transporter (DMT)-like permease
VLAIILGFTTAVVYGFADFFGALASRKLRPVLVTGLAGWLGLALLILVATTGLMPANFTAPAIFWGILGGLFSAFGLSCLYKALALGPISVLSPLGAVVAGLVPTVVGVTFLGETFRPLGWLAIGLVLVAVVLVGFVPGKNVHRPSLPALLYGLGAGVGIGAVLICLHNAPMESGSATIILVRLANGLILGGWAAFLILTGKVSPKEFKGLGSKFWWMALATGALDATANVIFVLASRLGTLTVVSVLTALYPLGTILLARLVLKEKIAISQTVGIALAMGASVLLALN